MSNANQLTSPDLYNAYRLPPGDLELLFGTRFDPPTAPIPVVKDYRTVVLIPAHNETDQIGQTLQAVFGQSHSPDEVFVLTDNAPQELAVAASQYPCSITCSVGNRHKKAGNLNGMLSMLLPELSDDDVVFGFDADSVPDNDFMENALNWLDNGYDAVGATFHGRSGGGYLGILQRAEFARFARHQNRRTKCDVLSGTGWAVRVKTLREICATRTDGTVYDVTHITEDFELTLALLMLGKKIISPSDCRVTTDVMTTIPDLISQRLRWQHGTLYALIRYGWTDVTSELIFKQFMTYVAMIATPLVVVYLSWSFILFGWAGINPANAPIYAIGLAIVLGEQAWQAKKAGILAIIMTLLIIPDFIYSVARQTVYVRALYRMIRGRKHDTWGAGTDI
jgi:biofilm PGA synthesis N-glycosyltransferase PgaC